jgi:hypothetical protein
MTAGADDMPPGPREWAPAPSLKSIVRTLDTTNPRSPHLVRPDLVGGAHARLGRLPVFTGQAQLPPGIHPAGTWPALHTRFSRAHEHKRKGESAAGRAAADGNKERARLAAEQQSSQQARPAGGPQL